MNFVFEWNDQKATINKRKHGVTFDEAQTVFTDDFSITTSDIAHADNEDRFLIMGMSHQRRVIVVSYTQRGERIRLISARKATRHERTCYEEDRT